MPDLIDRTKLIKAIERRCGANFDIVKALDPAMRVIEEIPEFNPERKGEWLYLELPVFEDFPFTRDGFWVCSCCHEEYREISDFDFCPHCGAKMEVSKE